jgi:hypothetical protein
MLTEALTEPPVTWEEPSGRLVLTALVTEAGVAEPKLAIADEAAIVEDGAMLYEAKTPLVVSSRAPEAGAGVGAGVGGEVESDNVIWLTSTPARAAMAARTAAKKLRSLIAAWASATSSAMLPTIGGAADVVVVADVTFNVGPVEAPPKLPPPHSQQATSAETPSRAKSTKVP